MTCCYCGREDHESSACPWPKSMLAQAIACQGNAAKVMDGLDRSRAQVKGIAKAKGRQSKLSPEQWDDFRDYASIKPRTMDELRTWMLRYTGQLLSNSRISIWLKLERIEFSRQPRTRKLPDRWYSNVKARDRLRAQQ